ncbi:ceramide phosphoethanolamine synthase-like [Physella acuta]|uniref:ceramide phosphoethanolamine synthase-like n=1 Tax=Physella acuta TaxID=109671 RepID=UPI0027DAEE61|nr:ceramide phosphoethanolamine synthase-like [Physella acuta]
MASLVEVKEKTLIRSEGRALVTCPCSPLTAYWTPPPTWPRRVLCENKHVAFSLTRGCWVLISAIFLTYFLVMDVFLFARFRFTSLVLDSRPGAPGEIYSPFTHLSVKAVLSDHVRHYFMTPVAEYLNVLTGFSSLFPFITPNLLSVTHLLCAFIAGKFISSEHLQDRQIGVLIFFFRTWLDSFDGTVFRAQSGVHLQYNSVYSSSGYFIDGFFDTLGGFFLSFGVFFYLLKRYGPRSSSAMMPTWTKDPESCTEELQPIGGQPTAVYSCRVLFCKVLSYGVCLAVAGVCWDRTVKEFTEVFQTELTDPSLSALQFKLSHNMATMVIFCFWRFISGQTVQTYMQIALYMDKVMDFLRYSQWILLALTLPLYVITVLYISHIRVQLHL